jgi:1,4-dihydroxy-2-naphthoate octaprenyltransferase
MLVFYLFYFKFSFYIIDVFEILTLCVCIIILFVLKKSKNYSSKTSIYTCRINLRNHTLFNINKIYF